MEHPNIVRFYSLQRDDASNVIGLVMEYVPGQSLHVLLHRDGPFEERKLLDASMDIMVTQIAGPWRRGAEIRA